jgi:hypothetical protein
MSQRGGIALIFILTGSLASAQQGEPRDYSDCDGIAEDAARLACYDEVSRQRKAPPAELAPSREREVIADEPPEAPAEPAPVEPLPVEPSPAAASASEEVREVPEDLGLSPGERGEDTSKESFRARVVDCRLGNAGKIYFIFDNGQIWQQSDERRVRLDDCDFAATISKDMFGYKLRPEDGGRGVRISRVR